MKYLLLILLFLIICIPVSAQTDNVNLGSISFISSENVYVKFASTSGIRAGDTLFVKKGNVLQPAVIVNALSSLSCVGKPVSGFLPVLNLTLIAKKFMEIPPEVKIEKQTDPVSVIDQTIQKDKKPEITSIPKKNLYGRFSVSSYTNLSTNTLSTLTPNSRLKYNLSINADSISGTGLSFENYMSYTHKLLDPTENYKDLKIYNLALRYNFRDNSTLMFGRKINVNTANIGAIDGFQYEKKFKTITAGALIGSRPNDSTYAIDPVLFQYGAYVSHAYNNREQTMQTSLAFFNQTNRFATDRRYLYLQHSNNLFRNVDFFGSAEVDLFSVVNNKPVTNFNPTGIYLSLSYRPVKNLSLSASFDARRNVYYFETYKNRIDSLLDRELRQGLRFRFTYHPFQYFTWGGSAGYRLNSPTAHPSANAYTFLNYSKLPFIDASVTFTGTALKTLTYSGFIYGINMSKDFLDGKFSVDGEYRKAQLFNQDIAEIGVLWHISEKFILSVNSEATFDKDVTLGRIFLNLTKRF